MRLPSIARTALNLRPVNGPFSEYLNATETAILIALFRKIEPATVLELGCNIGITAARVLENVPSIVDYYGCDVPFGFRTTLGCQQSEVRSEPGRYAFHDSRFHLLVSAQGSAWILGELELESVDAIFIDGDHSYNGVMRDSDSAGQLIRSPGIIVWHDYGNPYVEVTEALEELYANGWPIQHVADTWTAFAKF